MRNDSRECRTAPFFVLNLRLAETGCVHFVADHD
jgi:hypothetical protein